jgi:hypothetical protein
LPGFLQELLIKSIGIHLFPFISNLHEHGPMPCHHHSLLWNSSCEHGENQGDGVVATFTKNCQ